LAYAVPGATSEYYSLSDASSPQGSLSYSWWLVFKYISTPGANGAPAGKGNSVAALTGYRWLITTGNLLTFRVGTGSAVTVSASKTLTAGNWYIAHAVTDGTDVRLYIDGALNGSPVAHTAFGGNATGLSIAATAAGVSGIGSNIYVAALGMSTAALTSGQVSTHTAAIKAAKKCSVPGIGGTEYNWSAEDAGASWVDEGQGSSASRNGAGWTYGTDASPTWGA
jgi:hypothetical protein